MTPAHEQHQHCEFLLYYPEHEARERDSHYHVFEETKRRIKEQGLWKCSVPGCQRSDIELHHSKVEFSLINGIDLGKFNELYGLHLTDEEFQVWVEGPENTTPYCRYHHRGAEGIHFMRVPEWEANIVRKDNLPPFCQVVRE